MSMKEMIADKPDARIRIGLRPHVVAQEIVQRTCGRGILFVRTRSEAANDAEGMSCHVA